MLEYYVDGACSGNPGVGGWASVLTIDNEYCMTEYGATAETTNNRMELTAILAAYKNFNGAYGKGAGEARIYSDSAYCVNMLNTWIWSWKDNGWTRGKKHEKIENLDLVKELYDYRVKFGDDIIIHKVDGHSGNHWNEVADKMAVAAREAEARDEEKISEEVYKSIIS